ncbi:bacterio-opsin activator (plasmid) [Haloferax mediterranei ATCC 33500]|uniref:Bacterio-opsin activator n=1 Tax=Haloferax mediterranei (strain ATCC 33500 / DSM 1411 / JCM 8866 / NBRC 14739 / NCIMB 2177 / R-4) TaxID=523841 RepID=I3R9D7_HALMT|nr:helix-turn-helix domain-containing protein [Haloferax mediterranei]AFK20847.1 bacterio-opsin activator [Haloferax mediterranei ATCC 33500]AHZ24278.1 bacterio-opsin activator [Haloferax mediterranei ATCC 33500]EMA05362.1 bacterio-opsin activator [Haloferax mediterranei ATCC 33500]MDX5989839.1 helix-turn-helix domain-containing protein [Haloferax mediterranei ATCC 33500]QCQ77282.1 bacterio-opsin activator [Haloferax mediterranei ATCC 33500]
MAEPKHEKELLHLSLEVWHPDCWGIVSTAEAGSGLIGHGAAVEGDSAYERCTIYGDSREHVTQAIEVAHEISFINHIEPIGGAASEGALPSAIGRATQDVFIEYVANEGIGSAFLTRGVLVDSSYRIEDGVETWNLLAHTTRSSLGRLLDEIREERNADISLTKISPASEPMQPPDPGETELLTPRQREAVNLARERGYYNWPREITARELASELDVSKTTFLEHLRKAEAKLMGNRE